jgi:hypothetical protein
MQKRSPPRKRTPRMEITIQADVLANAAWTHLQDALSDDLAARTPELCVIEEAQMCIDFLRIVSSGAKEVSLVITSRNVKPDEDKS